MLIEPHMYRKAFLEYIRRGTPIHLSLKQEQSTTHYIWRTRRDGKVRPSHAANDGQVFSWEDPPDTGHPGDAPGCRCTAEPYLPETTEFMTITLQSVSGGGSAWSSEDFVRHYFQGNGRGVTVRQTGHLAAIVSQYMAEVEDRLKLQIAREARGKRSGGLSYSFNNSYDMTGIAFSIGDTVIGGTFSGSVAEEHGVLSIEGEFDFYLRDEFVDPLDIGIEVIDPEETIRENIVRPTHNRIDGLIDQAIRDAIRRSKGAAPPVRKDNLGVHTGDPYSITDQWTGELSGRIYMDNRRSAYA